MARESKEVWVKRVERWRGSGLTAQEFAAELGVNAATLANWRYRLSAEERKAARDAASAGVEVEAPAFVEISPTQTCVESGPASVAPMFEVVLAGGAILRVPAQFDAVALRRLLDVVAPR